MYQVKEPKLSFFLKFSIYIGCFLASIFTRPALKKRSKKNRYEAAFIVSLDVSKTALEPFGMK